MADQIEKICPFCQGIFLDSEIKRHIAMEHLGIPKALETLDNNAEIQEEKKKKTEQLKPCPLPKEKHLKCSYCQENFYSQASLTRHHNIFHRGSPYDNGFSSGSENQGFVQQLQQVKNDVPEIEVIEEVEVKKVEVAKVIKDQEMESEYSTGQAGFKIDSIAKLLAKKGDQPKKTNPDLEQVPIIGWTENKAEPLGSYDGVQQTLMANLGIPTNSSKPNRRKVGQPKKTNPDLGQVPIMGRTENKAEPLGSYAVSQQTMISKVDQPKKSNPDFGQAPIIGRTENKAELGSYAGGQQSMISNLANLGIPMNFVDQPKKTNPDFGQVPIIDRTGIPNLGLPINSSKSKNPKASLPTACEFCGKMYSNQSNAKRHAMTSCDAAKAKGYGEKLILSGQEMPKKQFDSIVQAAFRDNDKQNNSSLGINDVLKELQAMTKTHEDAKVDELEAFESFLFDVEPDVFESFIQDDSDVEMEDTETTTPKLNESRTVEPPIINSQVVANLAIEDLETETVVPTKMINSQVISNPAIDGPAIPMGVSTDLDSEKFPCEFCGKMFSNQSDAKRHAISSCDVAKTRIKNLSEKLILSGQEMLKKQFDSFIQDTLSSYHVESIQARTSPDLHVSEDIEMKSNDPEDSDSEHFHGFINEDKEDVEKVSMTEPILENLADVDIQFEDVEMKSDIPKNQENQESQPVHVESNEKTNPDFGQVPIIGRTENKAAQLGFYAGDQQNMISKVDQSKRTNPDFGQVPIIGRIENLDSQPVHVESNENKKVVALKPENPEKVTSTNQIKSLLKCDFCEFTTYYRANLARHKKRKHQNSQDEEVTIEAEIRRDEIAQEMETSLSRSKIPEISQDEVTIEAEIRRDEIAQEMETSLPRSKIPEISQDEVTIEAEIRRDEIAQEMETSLSRSKIPEIIDFLQDLLKNEKEFGECITWKNKDIGIFKIVDPEGLAELWGIKKNAPSMTYDRLTRVLRSCYTKNILRKQSRKVQDHHCYQFLQQVTRSSDNIQENNDDSNDSIISLDAFDEDFEEEKKPNLNDSLNLNQTELNQSADISQNSQSDSEIEALPKQDQAEQIQDQVEKICPFCQGIYLGSEIKSHILKEHLGKPETVEVQINPEDIEMIPDDPEDSDSEPFHGFVIDLPKFHCKLCDKKFRHPRGFKKHKCGKYLESASFRFQCNKCSKKFMDFNDLKLHVSQLHNSDFLTCKGCGSEYELLEEHLEHQKVCSPGSKRLAIKLAKLSKRQLERSKFEYSRNFKVRNPNDKRPAYQCQHCEKSYPSSRNLYRHVLVEHKGHRYTCKVCGLEFKEKYLMKAHVENVHEGVKHRCEYCDQLFPSTIYLNQHMRIEHGVTDYYKCQECEEGFNRKEELVKHVKIVHQGSEFYRCRKCDVSFIKKENLTRHNSDVHKDEVREE